MILSDWLMRYSSKLKTTNTINKLRHVQLTDQPYTRFVALTTAIVLIATVAAFMDNTKAAYTHIAQVSAKQTEQSLTKNAQSTSAPITTTTTPSQTINTTPEAPTPVAAASPTLPKVQEDPTMSWINNYTGSGSILDKFTDDYVALEGLYGDAVGDSSSGTIIYGGDNQSVCEQTQADVTTANGIPNPPNATLNSDWQAILTSFTGQYKDCFFLTSGPIVIATMNAQEPVNPSDISNGASDVQALDSAILQYEQQLDSQTQSDLNSIANTTD